MLGFTRRLLTIAAAVSLGGALASCSADHRQDRAEHAFSALPSESIVTTDDPTSSPAIEPASASASPTKKTEASPAAFEEEGVGIAGSPEAGRSVAIDPDAGEDKPFDGGKPSLHGIALGDTDASVKKRFGAAALQYALPGDDATIDIWEYEGFSVGFTAEGVVSYVEVTSSEVETGISGLKTGIPGAKAADALEIAPRSGVHVLTANVSGGWLKLDLDPDTHDVLSIKLIGTP